MNKPDLGPKERTQELLNLYKDIDAYYSAEAERQWLETNEGWQDALIKQHGEKPLEEKLAKVSGMIDRFETDMRARDPTSTTKFGEELREEFALTGAGNSPATVNFLIWLAEQMSEGTPLAGSPAGGAERSRAERLFGT